MEHRKWQRTGLARKMPGTNPIPVARFEGTGEKKEIVENTKKAE
jgi:hypothetical protein